MLKIFLLIVGFSVFRFTKFCYFVILLYPSLHWLTFYFFWRNLGVNSNKEQKILSSNLYFLKMFDNYYFVCGTKTFPIFQTGPRLEGEATTSFIFWGGYPKRGGNIFQGMGLVPCRTLWHRSGAVHKAPAGLVKNAKRCFWEDMSAVGRLKG